ncbi:MAG: Glucokinase [Planctomycetota bacterium]
MRTVLAGDLGGTKCRFALVAEDLSVAAVQQFATVREREPFLAAFDGAIAAALAQRPAGWEAPTAAGFGTAGVIPLHGRSIDRAPNLPLDDYPLADHVAERFALPTAILNDGRASAWGEYVRGHAAGADPLLCLFFGTGIGIGLMVSGKPYLGAANAAGEIGHTIFRPGGRRCPCGGLGHFEAYCGGRAIIERAAEEIAPQAPAELGGGRWSAGSVAAAANLPGAAGAAARAILDDAASASVALVANACTLLNPAAVVLGGGVLTGWPALRARIETEVPQLTSRLIHEGLRFASSLGESDAILWGAAAAAGLSIRRR